MQSMWFEGQLFAEIMCDGESGKYPFPVYFQFFNNGILSVTLGNDSFIPSENDLHQLGDYIQGVSKAMGIPDDQVFVGAYRGQIAK